MKYSCFPLLFSWHKRSHLSLKLPGQISNLITLYPNSLLHLQPNCYFNLIVTLLTSLKWHLNKELCNMFHSKAILCVNKYTIVNLRMPTMNEKPRNMGVERIMP